jgi:hypothetical protein
MLVTRTREMKLKYLDFCCVLPFIRNDYIINFKRKGVVARASIKSKLIA